MKTNTNIDMTIICDFDHTLFCAGRFKDALASSLVDLGIDKDGFFTSYQNIVKRDKKKYDYDYQLHAALLANKFKVSKQKIIQKLESIIKKTKVFLYPDTEDFLGKLQSNKVKLIILTLGNASFQKLKFKLSKLKKYFDERYFVERVGEKNKIVAKIIQNDEDTYYLNDKPSEILEAKKQFPKLKILYIQRPDGKYKKMLRELKSFSNLKEISGFLQKHENNF